MSLIATWTSSASTSELTQTTSSAIVISDILTGAVIALVVVVSLLALSELASTRDAWNPHTAAALQAFYLPLLVTFYALVAFATVFFL